MFRIILSNLDLSLLQGVLLVMLSLMGLARKHFSYKGQSGREVEFTAH